ncbi:hypothetical protein [Streptomyces parvulus]|uniref:hypothetical protein n=1 Tax=Streptomyces parvulus TaxID=146923 RepID=UPI0037FF43AD
MGVGTGSSVTIAVSEDITLPDSSITLPIVCMAAWTLLAVRQLLTRQERRTRNLLDGMHAEHDQRAEGLAARERSIVEREQRITEREQLLQRQAYIYDLRVQSAFGRLDMVTAEKAAKAREVEELRREYDHLCEDYNDLALEQGRRDEDLKLAMRPVAVGETAATRNGPRRQRGRPGPFSLSVVETAREHQDSC